MNCSIIIRTYNEGKYLAKVLESIQNQSFEGNFKIIVIDSGSTDNTLQIAETYKCKTVHIKKEQFSFGRSLNYGCDAATGDLLIFISAFVSPIKDDKPLPRPFFILFVSIMQYSLFFVLD